MGAAIHLERSPQHVELAYCHLLKQVGTAARATIDAQGADIHNEALRRHGEAAVAKKKATWWHFGFAAVLHCGKQVYLHLCQVIVLYVTAVMLFFINPQKRCYRVRQYTSAEQERC